MAWTDRPTPAQLGTYGHMLHWAIDDDEYHEIVAYLEKNITRMQMSQELSRLHNIRENRIGKSLDREDVWASPLLTNLRKEK